MMRKGQYTLEFMLLIAGILVIFIPAIYFFMDYGLDVKSDMVSKHVESFSKKITHESRDLYYRGSFNKETVTLKVPQNVNNITSILVNSTTGNENEYYLRVNYTTSSGKMSTLVSSEVPIISGRQRMVNDCFPNKDCYYFYLGEKSTTLGLRDFRFEATNWRDMMVINVTVI